MTIFTRAEFEAAAAAVKKQTKQEPRIGLVLGSGLGDLADSVENADIIPYRQISHWPISTVVGHQGQLHIGQLEGQLVIVMRGRCHYYEGYPISQITLPIRVMQLMGVEIVILTNAAGGIDPSFSAGDLMLITDHMNLIGMGGTNPLIGPNDDSLGPRFPDMSRVYDRDLRALAVEVARAEGISLQKGVYAGLAGPSFETPADVRFLRAIGANAVGMSTVPEAIVARHGGMRVLGFSGISNVAIDDPDSDRETTHEEVLEAGKVIVPRLTAILRGLLRRLDSPS
ncbi:MAG: purine-nucleoside phosphorylase [Anaerolineae bacterium]|nr:purine-nucleoside phosphorylase [Anaerolineae bacterium]